jgi:hypothetical protein
MAENEILARLFLLFKEDKAGRPDTVAVSSESAGSLLCIRIESTFRYLIQVGLLIIPVTHLFDPCLFTS